MTAPDDGHPAPARRPAPARSPAPARQAPLRRPVHRNEPIALVDLLDRVLAGGVVISGEVRLAIADVDLVTVSLRALVSSASTVLGTGPGSGDEAGD